MRESRMEILEKWMFRVGVAPKGVASLIEWMIKESREER